VLLAGNPVKFTLIAVLFYVNGYEKNAHLFYVEGKDTKRVKRVKRESIFAIKYFIK